MSKQTKKLRRFPPKTINFGGVPVEFKKINEDLPSALYYYHNDGRGYQELYPSIYSIELPDAGGFTKLWDFFPDEYLENRQLITFRQFSLYNYIATLRNRGYYLSIKGSRSNDQHDGDGNLTREGREVKGLTAVTNCSRRTLIADLDHLEDCLLIHRVRRLDLQGIPTELVVHTPFTRVELDENGWHKVIADRIAKQATATRRSSVMISGETEEGHRYSYLDRKSRQAGFSFDYGAIKDAFGDSCHKFTNFALRFFKKNFWALEENKPGFDKDYRYELGLEMNVWGITRNERRERCYAAAHVFRSIYCPSFEEILA